MQIAYYIEVNIPSVTLGSEVIEYYATPNANYTVKIVYNGSDYIKGGPYG